MLLISDFGSKKMTLNKETALKRESHEGRNVCGVVLAQPLKGAKSLPNYPPAHPPLCVGDVHLHTMREYEIHDFGTLRRHRIAVSAKFYGTTLHITDGDDE
jgi:hypothetical protein